LLRGSLLWASKMSWASKMLLLRSRPFVPVAAVSAAAASILAANNHRSESAASPSSLHLKYFEVQGVVETARHVLALGRQEWTESAYPIDFSKFKDGVEAAAPAFAAARAAGELEPNMGRAPILVVDGVHAIPQSKTIERYLARKLGLFGATEEDGAAIDAITEHVRDIKDKYQKAKVTDEGKAKWFASEMPEWMGKLEKAVGPSTSAPLVGASLSLADVTLYVFLVDFYTDKAAALASIDKCPRLKASVNAVEKNPAVAKYRAARTMKGT